MKHFKILILLVMATLMSGAWAKSKSREFQSKILNMRVLEILNYRIKGLEACLAANKGYTALEHQQFKNHRSSYLRGVYHTEEEVVVATLELLASTEKHPKCAKEIKEADAKLKRVQQKKFEVPMVTAMASCVVALNRSGECVTNVATILAELDPFCVTQNSADIFGVKDGNACMAGDRLLGRMLRSKNDPTQTNITQFLATLEATISSAPKNSNVDMWKVFLINNKDSSKNREQFIALMTFFYYSLGSAGGYIDGVADHYWASALKESDSPSDIFAEYYSMRQKVDWYGFLIHKKAKDLNLRFSFKHIALKGMNRHDYMSMFLSCHFRNYGDLNAKIIPEILGFGYESLDFVSHMKENVGFKGSVENFKKDTSRYTVGSTLGNSFCNFKF